MRIKVTVTSNHHTNLVEISWREEYNVFTTTDPDDDKANKRVQELLAAYFGKPKSKIVLDNGGKSKEKFYEILD